MWGRGHGRHHCGQHCRIHPALPRSAQEVKEEPFFKGLDWQMVFLQKVRGAQGTAAGHGQAPAHCLSPARSTPRLSSRPEVR